MGAGESEVWTQIGTVTAPSGILAFAMAGWADLWPQTGTPLSRRGGQAAGGGGVHVHDGLAEAVVVRADPRRPLPVRATTAPSPFDGADTIAVLEVELDLPWASNRDSVLLGDLLVDRCGMVLGDAAALDGFVGLGGKSIDGPLMAGTIDLAGARILGLEWDQGDHSMRHRGERQYGQVYPVTLEPGPASQTVLRWSIPPGLTDTSAPVLPDRVPGQSDAMTTWCR